MEVARDILARGVCAHLVCVDTHRLDASFRGLDYDRDLIERLPAGVCPIGESPGLRRECLHPGFHTLQPVAAKRSR